ncbi:PEP-CTERM motif [Luteitalea pratensis]|uniref:PEP-CTERM motif n=1 Tax=Luteitalea pratensis TaxID=1855912 RepID=A0A143PPK1_LUTPR|nr:PEP-CTERM sorting domain-containing protein [Luteitalea pratensis]AMY10060.1 PEP-CTERM motif [Luteitalea pratensis]
MSLKTAVIALAVAGVATLGGATSASAVPIMLQFNVAALGNFTANTGDVTTATTITNGAPTVVGAIQQNNIGLVAGQTVTLAPNPMGVTVGSAFTKSFTAGGNTFVETLTVTSATPTANALGILAAGTITCTVGAGCAAFDPTAVFWSAAYTQNAGPGTQINGSFNNSTTPPPPQVPEPTSMVLLGMGMLGAGIARRRRQ